MTRGEFRKRLDRLVQVITRGLTYYALWMKLRFHEEGNVSWSLEEQNEVVGRFNGFFSPVILALGDMALMQFAKVFDADARTASLTNLLAAAEKDPSLVPRANAADVAKASRDSQNMKTALTELRRRRNQSLAHADASPAAPNPLLIRDLDEMVKCAKTGAAFLSTSHCGQALAWEVWEAEWHTTRAFEILLEETKLAKAGRTS